MSKYKFSKKVGKEIPDSEATTWISNYKKRHKDGIHAYFFGADIIHRILKNPEAVGLRVYLGYSLDEHKKEKLQMVLIGAREDGSSIWSDSSLDTPGDGGGTVADGGQSCPPYC